MCSRGSLTSHPFVLSHQAEFLDILCRRYPGTRPSEFRDDLDEYQAFQFDLAMAFKGYLRDKEAKSDEVYTLLQGMVGIMKSNGGKPGKIPKPKPLVKPPVDTQLPSIHEVLNALGGVGVAVEEIK